MNEHTKTIPAAKWHTCVRTVKCEAIDDYVSLMVKNDWTSQCTWYKQFKDSVTTGQKGQKPNRETRKKIDLCKGPLCSILTDYRDQLIREEVKAAPSPATC